MGSDQIVPARINARLVFERRPTVCTPAETEEIAAIHAWSRGFHARTRTFLGRRESHRPSPAGDWSRRPVSTLSIPDSIAAQRGQGTKLKPPVQVRSSNAPTAVLKNRDSPRECNLGWW
jgi:hypothetical protein